MERESIRSDSSSSLGAVVGFATPRCGILREDLMNFEKPSHAVPFFGVLSPFARQMSVSPYGFHLRPRAGSDYHPLK
jgi:hypothetical protein